MRAIFIVPDHMAIKKLLPPPLPELAEQDKENAYFLADSKGILIWKADTICINDKTDGEKNIILWDSYELHQIQQCAKANSE